MTGRERVTLLALAGIAGITAAWWALALWPLAPDAPYWLVRTREVCFGSLPDTLPTKAGWLLLIAEPLTMVAALAVMWPGQLVGALSALARSGAGRVALVVAALSLAGGAAAASARVTAALRRGSPPAQYVPPPPANYPRVDRPAPALALVDQRGTKVTLTALRGRIVLVTFAFAHCATACPVVVRETLEAQRRLADPNAVVVVVTLDPWRDTPERLASIAAAWRLGEAAYVLSGDTLSVLATLDAWQVPHGRDLTTGDITHPAVVYILDREGRIAYAAAPNAGAIASLARRAG